jgi:serine/threonine protein kinase
MTRVNATERFQVERTLGRGGMGTVHQAYDNARGTMVALKMLHRLDPTSLLRFKTEFRALANLSHPNLVQLFELVQRDEDYLLSMELVDGPDFLGYVRSLGESASEVEAGGDTSSIPGTPATGIRPSQPEDNQPPRQVAQLDEQKLRHALRQLAEGLFALHASGHLHRDLKPANVLVFRADERLVICDFGLVVENTTQRPRMHSIIPGVEPKPSQSQTSTSGEIAGTLAFMSPEQTAGLELTNASDWYAVGAMLYQALTLRVPFDPHLAWADAVRVRQERMPDHPLMLVPDAPADLANLAMALLQTEPARRAGHAEVMATLDGQSTLELAPSSPLVDLLVGRESELSRLHEALAATRRGKPGVAMVSGMSGMGKSAVVQRFLADCEDAGALVLRGRCYEAEELPYKAFDPLMDALSGYLMSLERSQVDALLPPDASCLAEMFPVLGRVSSIANRGLVSSVSDPFERKRRATTACRRLLKQIATQRPLILYVDDLQWGDLDSGPLFADLLRGGDTPLLLLFAFRAEDEAQSPLIRALREQYLPAVGVRERTELRIEPLTPQDAERLARARLTGSAHAERLVQEVVNEACGSPFFIRELAAFVRSQSPEAKLELKLAVVLEARVAALPDHSRQLLEFVAAAGRPEPQALLNEASGLGERAFAAGQILKAHNLVHGSGTLQDARLEAYHDRIRETVYQKLTPDRQRYLHRVLAVSLEQLAERNGQTRDAEALCEHWSKAGERKRAHDYAVLAAENAEATLAFLHAAKLYQKAIELVDRDPRLVSQHEGKVGRALMYAGRGVEAADAFFRAMPGADPSEAQDHRRMAITQLLGTGTLERAFAELRNAEDVFGLSLPKSTLDAVRMLIWRRLRTKLNDKALAKAKAKAPQQVSQELDNMYKVSTALSTVDFLRGGVYTAEHTLRALQHGHPYHLTAALSIESIRSAGPNTDPAQTQWIIDRGLELARKSGDPYGLAITTGCAGVSRYLEGRFEEAIQLVRESQRIHREQLRSTMVWDITTMQFFELRALSLVGRVQEIVARVPDVLRDAEARGDRYASTLFRVSRLGWAWLGTDQPELAQQHIDTAERQWSQEPYQLMHYYTLQALGETALYRGRAADVWQRALAERKQMKLVGKIQFTRVENTYLVGRLALQLAKIKKDPQALREAEACAKALSREKVAWSRPLGQLLIGCILASQAPERARAQLLPLPAAFEKLDMLLPAAVVRYRLGQLDKSAAGVGATAAARDEMAALGVTNPEAFAEMLAPGF